LWIQDANNGERVGCTLFYDLHPFQLLHSAIAQKSRQSITFTA
jgi:hypothetical protein